MSEMICKAALHEIKAVFAKYNLGGFVHVASPEHAMYELLVEPTWSMAKLRGHGTNGASIHFKLRANDIDRASQTAHLLLSTRDTCAYMARALDSFDAMLRQCTQVDHKPFTPGVNTSSERKCPHCDSTVIEWRECTTDCQDCSCHIAPPCSHCTDGHNKYRCQSCGEVFDE